MVHLNIGSNLKSQFGNRFSNISASLDFLTKSNFCIKKVSDFYETPSYPNRKLPFFLNVGVLGDYNKSYLELINTIKKIEKKIGRIKTKKNGPRVSDIDIIDFNNKVINSNNISIPHKKCHIRNFVLFPIKQIDPNWMHPITQKNIDYLIKKLDTKSRIEITRLNKNAIV